MTAARVLTLAAVLTGVLLAAEPAGADPHLGLVGSDRVGGAERFETAAEIATTTFDAAEVAVVATGERFADALAASYAAGAVQGPVLLVGGAHVPEATWQALAALEVSRVVLVGGPAAIDPTVRAALDDAGYAPQRIGGGDRYATAAALAEAFADAGVGDVGGERTAVLASGADFPDAISAGPLAAAGRLPLLLTPPDTAHERVDEALRELEIERVLVVGGASAVSAEVAEHYADAYTVERLAGRTRTETAVVLAREAAERVEGIGARRALLARGDDFPDALAASMHAAALSAPVLLAATPAELSAPTRAWFAAACPQLRFVRAIGGGAALAPATRQAAVAAAEECYAEISTFTTPLEPGQDRNHNIRLAAEYIDGSIIEPGESFSLNAAIGPRTRERGFVEDGFINEDGEVVRAVGGGVSQMATTFVNAAWFAGIDLVEFRPHTKWFERYPMCREATLVWGQLDVRVTNDTPYPMAVRAAATETSVTVTLIGRPWAGVSSWTSEPFNTEGSGGAFSVTCGRELTYPDGSTASEDYFWRYEEGSPG